MSCNGTTVQGNPCDSPLADASGFCPAHREDGPERMRELASRGGRATAAKHEGAAFTADQVRPIQSIEDCKLALDEIRIAVMCRRLTHAEANAASKSVSEWVKAQAAGMTEEVVNKLRAALRAQAVEIDDLRKQLAASRRPQRMAS